MHLLWMLMLFLAAKTDTMNFLGDYWKSYFEPLIKIILCVILISIIRFSGIEDLTFYLSKKTTSATVLEIIKKEGLRSPYRIRVDYYNGENKIEDFIFVDKTFMESLYLGKSEEIFYSNLIWRNVYFVDYSYPRLFIVFCQLFIYFAVVLVAYQAIETLIKALAKRDLVVE